MFKCLHTFPNLHTSCMLPYRIELIHDCSIELTIGRRYGLIGLNGSGEILGTCCFHLHVRTMCCCFRCVVDCLAGRLYNGSTH